jgi:hypothetical protein
MFCVCVNLQVTLQPSSHVKQQSNSYKAPKTARRIQHARQISTLNLKIKSASVFFFSTHYDAKKIELLFSEQSALRRYPLDTSRQQTKIVLHSITENASVFSIPPLCYRFYTSTLFQFGSPLNKFLSYLWKSSIYKAYKDSISRIF